MDNSVQIEERAARWLLKRDSATWSAQDEIELQAWLQASASHRVAFIRLKSVWQDSARLKVLAGSFPRGEVPRRGATVQLPFFGKRDLSNDDAQEREHLGAGIGAPAMQASRGARLRFSVAASVLVVVALGSTATLWSSGGPSYRTAVGGLASIPMDDGSRVTLNTDTEVELKLTQTERRIDLSRGEAFFEVAKDPLRPFVVYADGRRIVAIGTKFAVRIAEQTIQIAVTEGKVRVEKPVLMGRGEPIAQLSAGHVASSDGSAVSVQDKPVDAIEQTLSWRAGYVALRGTLLSEAVTEFNRYNTRQLVIEDPSIAAIRVGGNFKVNNVDGFLRLLQEGFAVHAENRREVIVLTAR